MTRPLYPLVAAVAAIAAVYVYFLLFAEFALLELARPALEGERFRILMAALGAGGVAGSLLSARTGASALWLRFHLLCAAVVALLAAWRSSAGWSGPWPWLVAGGCGFSTGGMTVTLASSLRQVCGDRLGTVCGLGTGLAYALCNAPAVFTAPPANQALVASAAALAGAANVGTLFATRFSFADAREPRRAVAGWTLVLLALVWLDSAAFYIIQHEPVLQKATWGGSAQLWLNALVHFAAALVSGLLLDKGRRLPVALLGFGTLALASLWLAIDRGTAAPAAWLYVFGVSFYSVLLVYWPARDARPAVAALVYAVAGWIGSALGIGLAENRPDQLGSLAPVSAAVFVLGLLLGRNPLRGGTALFLLSASLLSPGSREARADEASILRGRQVYIAEGCIHCHSQYLRPGTSDEKRWGLAVGNQTAKRASSPPLYGNRRQGPDLSNVGVRRSREWNRLHLIEPRALGAGSRMPAYPHLFADGDERGEALLDYLESLKTGDDETYWNWTRTRTLGTGVRASAESAELGRRLFGQLCASCHGVLGRGDGPLARKLTLRPPDFTTGSWRRIDPSEDPMPQLMRVIRFGLRGEPMAGHETLEERELVCLAEYVAGLHASPRRSP